MIEQPQNPDLPKQPDVIKPQNPVTDPISPSEPPPEERPDVHPAPPPTDPNPSAI